MVITLFLPSQKSAAHLHFLLKSGGVRCWCRRNPLAPHLPRHSNLPLISHIYQIPNCSISPFRFSRGPAALAAAVALPYSDSGTVAVPISLKRTTMVCAARAAPLPATATPIYSGVREQRPAAAAYLSTFRHSSSDLPTLLPSSPPISLLLRPSVQRLRAVGTGAVPKSSQLSIEQ